MTLISNVIPFQTLQVTVLSVMAVWVFGEFNVEWVGNYVDIQVS